MPLAVDLCIGLGQRQHVRQVRQRHRGARERHRDADDAGSAAEVDHADAVPPCADAARLVEEERGQQLSALPGDQSDTTQAIRGDWGGGGGGGRGGASSSATNATDLALPESLDPTSHANPAAAVTDAADDDPFSLYSANTDAVISTHVMLSESPARPPSFLSMLALGFCLITMARPQIWISLSSEDWFAAGPRVRNGTRAMGGEMLNEGLSDLGRRQGCRGGW